jgi:formylglycine-generating enzyme required for sulfatase activity
MTVGGTGGGTAAKLAACGLVLLLLPVGGCIRERCYRDLDCPAPKVCGAQGTCAWRCVTAEDCGSGFDCVAHACEPLSVIPDSGREVGDDVPVSEPECPDDMVLVSKSYCLDRYEASRTDATATGPGADGSRATSRMGVLPWQVVDNATAAAACVAAGKRLCSPAEWEYACHGPDGTEYAYGNAYASTACNGIDAFGEGGFHLAPTGSFPGCTNGYGAFDLSGNLWEHVGEGSDMTVRGGAFNCRDSAALHRCGYVPGTWTPSARGFRCCAAPTFPAGPPEVPDEPLLQDLPVPVDAADIPDVPSPIDAGPDGDGGGCLDPDTPPDAPRDVDAGPSDPGAVDPGPTDSGATDPGSVPRCPADMVPVSPAGVAAWCLDRYEASRDDATGSSTGTSSRPASRPGVLPWQSVTLDAARTACASAGKRLCTPAEWISSCAGPAATAYSYGNTYVADTCNGIDAFCDCAGACAAVAACPYPHCRVQASPALDGGPCGASFHVVPTGAFPACTNEWGAFDLNGNVWEIVEHGDGVEHFHGGAYNCSDSEALHRCDYDATWGPSARGFRCCADTEPP